MSYIVKEVEDTCGIYETQSENLIRLKKKSKKEIQALARKLNLGSGFNGWTPLFFAGYKKE